jgi:hypothetical protein
MVLLLIGSEVFVNPRCHAFFACKKTVDGDFRSTRQIERHVVARGVSYFVGAVFYNTEALTNIAIVGFDPRLGAGVLLIGVCTPAPAASAWDARG